MEIFFSLEREISMATEALAIERNWPIQRKWTHAELEPALKAIREIEAAKLQVPTAAQINAVMMDSLK